MEPLTLEFVLRGLDPGDDLDLCLWDPFTESIVGVRFRRARKFLRDISESDTL